MKRSAVNGIDRKRGDILNALEVNDGLALANRAWPVSFVILKLISIGLHD